MICLISLFDLFEVLGTSELVEDDTSLPLSTIGVSVTKPKLAFDLACGLGACVYALYIVTGVFSFSNKAFTLSG